MTPKKIWKICWKMARIPVKTEVMALMIEPRMDSTELVTDGILMVVIWIDVSWGLVCL